MKTISNFILATTAALLIQIAPAQQEPPPDVCFLRYVNAVAPGKGNANVIIDNEDIFPKGYALGQFTGGFGLKAGSHTFKVQKEGVESGSTKVNLKAGETMTFIGFAEKEQAKKGEEDKPPMWVTRILRLKQSDPQRGFQMTIVPVCAKDQLKCEVTSQEMKSPTVVFAKRLAINPVQLGNSTGDCILKVDGEPMVTLSPDSPGNYVVILYDDEDGNVKAISFFDPKFVVAG